MFFAQDYFGVCTEAAIKDNVVVVYELLEEMLDNGFPLATESNILKELIKPPTILRTMVNTITGTVSVHANHSAFKIQSVDMRMRCWLNESGQVVPLTPDFCS